MASSCDADAIFRVFTACPHDIKTLILDVRSSKLHKRLHLNQAYCIRLASDGKALVVSSSASPSCRAPGPCIASLTGSR